MLYHYRKRLDETGVRAQLGFLYDAYTREFWFFEICDMCHKLLVTSVIAFFPYGTQMPVAMGMVTIYTMIILAGRPYLRKGDDRLHLFAQTEIFLLLMAGNVFNTQNSPDALMDVVMSVVLIAAFAAFILFFAVQCLQALQKLFPVCWKKVRQTFRSKKKLEQDAKREEMKATQVKPSLETELPVYQRVVSYKNFRNENEKDGIVLTRNPVFTPTYVGDGGNASLDETTGEEVIVVRNPLASARPNVERAVEDVNPLDKLKSQLHTREHSEAPQTPSIVKDKDGEDTPAK